MRDFHLPGRSLVYAKNGMCATSHPLAAKAAVDILAAGGNAVDAAIAGAVLLGICEPQMTGIGGDCFALIDRPGQAVVGLNGSGRAPAALDAEALRASGHTQMPLYDNPASVTIPGAIDAFCTLSADHGKLGLDHVLAPAIHYAEEGVPVAPRVADDWSHCADMSGTAAKLYLMDGKPARAGQIFRAASQADVLRKIAAEGRNGFYTGEIAEDMHSALAALGGVHTLDDFAQCRSEYITPIQGSYKGYDLIELPPNGHGATAIMMANILSQFDIASMDPSGADRAHIEAEAAKLAYDARDRFVADGAPRLDHLLSTDTAKSLASLIDPERAMPSAAKASDNVHKDTIYITVVDKDRMAVSLIYSIFHSFGSRIATDKFGILFQNRGAGFNLIKDHPNEAKGGKRPMHTIIPGLLKRSDMVMPFGVMGGQYQPNGHARFLSNIADFGMDIQTAIDAPRCFWDAGDMKVERGYAAKVRAELINRGHAVSTPDTAIGGAQAIMIDGDVLIGASDPRKDGCALGY
jgi:gamma-glutamyltranspeptidase/glutathione hydrolase